MSRRLLLISLLVVIALAAAACGSSEEKTEENGNPGQPVTFETVSVQEAHERLNSDGQAIIVDVRNSEEWAATGYPPDARLIPPPEFQQRAPNELPEDADIYVICNSGNRSRAASQNLIDLGYTSVYNVEGGIQAWLQAGLPTKPYTP